MDNLYFSFLFSHLFISILPALYLVTGTFQLLPNSTDFLLAALYPSGLVSMRNSFCIPLVVASLRARRCCLICQVQRRHWRFYSLTQKGVKQWKSSVPSQVIRGLLFRWKKLSTPLKQTQSWLWDEWTWSQGIRVSVLALSFPSLE